MAKFRNSSRYQFFIDNFNDPDEPEIIKGRGKYMIFKKQYFTKDED